VTATQDWSEVLVERIAEAICDAWNVEHANGPRDASVPEEWGEEAHAVLTALDIKPVGDGRRFGPGPVFRIGALNGSQTGENDV